MTLEEVGIKIHDALKRRQKVPNGVEFTYWLHSILTTEDLLILLQKDIKDGEEAVNDWLAQLLIESGYYQASEKKRLDST